ncbi:SgcJ/EcaC family oxidoreductase [Leeia sp. TBRC 13508]|uniref:SgcJ/EcaC family oxidoreductase n=1 Tax=Leeia speluncae TaxID=2884804 RepID=A0ABS8DAE5_9NEIS|nr:SgcJ/EcaC family oxidoreductase [Leeia speluncae]MCB6185102.1 SgcJ/EcaC family oxidoreductase [Leeia speluncae]
MDQPIEVVSRLEAAWNLHDMQAFGALFSKTASFVNRFGRYVHGVDQIIEMHAPIHETIYSDSTLSNELIDVEEIVEEVAVVHFWSRLTVGLAHPAGPHTMDTLVLAVLASRNGIWTISALENVTLTNPRTGEAMLRGDL